MQRLSGADWDKTSAFREYRRARQVLEYNRGFRRPGQDWFVKIGEKICARFEERYPDFREEFTRQHGARYK